jgi:dihydrolipoamide dehydrogenase
VGDVTGVIPLTHVAHYQAHLAADDIMGRPHPASYGSVPRVLFTDPQVAACGSIAARSGGRTPAEVTSATVDLTERPRGGPSSSERQEAGGRLTLFAEMSREVLVGAWAVAPDASEWIEPAAIAIRAEIPLAVLRDATEQFSSVGDVYLAALNQLYSAVAAY